MELSYPVSVYKGWKIQRQFRCGEEDIFYRFNSLEKYMVLVAAFVFPGTESSAGIDIVHSEARKQAVDYFISADKGRRIRILSAK